MPHSSSPRDDALKLSVKALGIYLLPLLCGRWPSMHVFKMHAGSTSRVASLGPAAAGLHKFYIFVARAHYKDIHVPVGGQLVSIVIL